MKAFVGVAVNMTCEERWCKNPISDRPLGKHHFKSYTSISTVPFYGGAKNENVIATYVMRVCYLWLNDLLLSKT